MTERRIDPGSLRLFYKPLDEPIIYWRTNLAGKHYTEELVGMVRAEWDSPEGVYVLLTATEWEYDTETLEEIRPRLAELVAESYEARKST